jgi:hypothetical protein
MHKMFLSCLLTAVLTAAAVAAAFVVGTGYFVGNYAVHFGLERGTVENPQEPPRAFAGRQGRQAADQYDDMPFHRILQI